VDKPRKFGEFLESLARPETASSPGTEDAAGWEEGWQQAIDRHFLPKRVKRLEERLKNSRLRSGSKAKCELIRMIVSAKCHFPKIASGRGSHKALARMVDVMLEKQKKKLIEVCPPGWRSIRDLPQSFSEVLAHPKLKRRAAVIISKAR
jgi:hypothetical protein